jgi:hypothetical protein
LAPFFGCHALALVGPLLVVMPLPWSAPFGCHALSLVGPLGCHSVFLMVSIIYLYYIAPQQHFSFSSLLGMMENAMLSLFFK